MDEATSLLTPEPIDPLIETMPVLGFDPTPLDFARSIMLFGVALRKADDAWRNDRRLSRMMRHDEDVILAMGLREYTVTGLTWKIDPEDPDDPKQAAEAAAIEKAIRRIKHCRQFLGHLERAFWYGDTGAAMNYRILPKPIIGTAAQDPLNPESGSVQAKIHTAPVAWMPIHSDSIRYTPVGEPVIITNYLTKAFEPASKELVDDGIGAKLEPNQRASIVFNIWGIDAPELDLPETSERPYGGFGMRARIWYSWMNKQLISQQSRHFAERLARGQAQVYYHAGNKDGKTQAEAILKAMYSSFGAVIPWDNEIKEKIVNILEVTGTGWQIFDKLEEMYARKIQKAILHQELMTGTGLTGTGMGSGVAEAHESTFAAVVRYDAEILGESLTHDLVRPMAMVNFQSEAFHRFRFISPDEDDDPAEFVERAQKAFDMGVAVSQREIYERGDLREPKPDEPTVGMGGGERGLFDDLDGDIGDLGDITRDSIATGGEDIQDTALNGAQIAELRGLAESVATGTLPKDAAVAIAEAAFAGVSADQVMKIFESIQAGSIDEGTLNGVPP